MFASREIAEITPPGYLPALTQDCIRDAQLVSDDVAQIERFTTQLSIRLFWMERSYPLSSPAQEDEKMEIKKADITKSALPEVGGSMIDESWMTWASTNWRTLVIKAAWPLVILCGLWLVLGALWRRHQRNQSQMIWLLPESKFKPRLGGPHCGGCGAMVKYG